MIPSLVLAATAALAPLPAGPSAAAATVEPPPATAPAAPAPAGAASLAVVPEDDEPMRDWVGSVSVGLSLVSGNTDQRRGNILADAKYRTRHDRTTLGFLWIYDEKRDPATGEFELNDRTTRGTAQYDYFLGPQWYALGQGLLEGDLASGVDQRWTLGAGLGYQFADKESTSFSAEAGISRLDETFYIGPSNRYWALRLAYTLGWRIVDSLRLDQTAQAYPSIEDTDDVYTKLDTSLRYDIYGSLFTKLTWLFDWNNQPAPGAERSDHRLLLTLGWSF
jgi:putative salt-induced outer membrane protein YdiY